MTTDDLNVPLGQRPNKRRRLVRVPVPAIVAGALVLFLGTFVVWAIVADDPFGGEPIAVASAQLPPVSLGKASERPRTQEAAGGTSGPGHYDGPPPKAPGSIAEKPVATAPPNTRTVTIIDGKTGNRQEVAIPAAAASNATPTENHAIAADQKFLEMTAHGAIPKIASDGVRPADAFAQPVNRIAGKPDAPRIALIVGGLGVSASATSAALGKLPGPVTLAFIPYGSDGALAARARAAGHEVLLQVPMEPFDYPDNDPGPQTLLTSLTAEQNLDRLLGVMSRLQGYVGIINLMGGRFTASEQAFAPVLHETAKRGLIFVDDGSNPRSVAGRIAGANNLPFAHADVTIDLVPTAAEIDRALARLEMMARERHVAVGMSSALPVSIAHIAKWAKAAESRGLLLVPISAVAAKDKQISGISSQ